MSEIVDLYLGKRLRSRRKLLGLTQAELGAICGVRFQQIQKYECATNHMSAAMLWRLAAGLGVGVQYFYEGLERPAAAPAVAIRDSTGRPAFEPASCAMSSA
jgi:transcriptional regulator with XRE-family HTH domain